MQSLTPYLFWIVAGLTGMSAIAVVASQNIVRSATWLLFTLGGVACIFFLLGADFVGAIQLLVYVGGTMVLVVFGVMLTAQGPFISMKTSGAEWAISIIAGMLLLGVLTTAVMSEHVELGPPRVKAFIVDPTGQPRIGMVVPEVKFFGPEISRAERARIAARRANVAAKPAPPPDMGMKGGKGVGPGPIPPPPTKKGQQKKGDNKGDGGK